MFNKSYFLFGLVLGLFQLHHARAANIPHRLPTILTTAEIQREALDEKLYPTFMSFIHSVDIIRSLQPIDQRNTALIRSPVMYQPSQALWDGFFRAAAADHLTTLRAFGLLAREIKKQGVVVWAPGAAFEKAIADNHIDLGLSLPACNLSNGIWSPDPDNKDPEFQVHVKLFYTQPYLHRFPDHILPANLKIGYGPALEYWMDGKQYIQHTVDADIYYGPHKGVGFRNIKGIGGQKRGLMGFMQKLLFFLPDAVESMVIDEKKGSMMTEALFNTIVEDFEKNPVYSIKITRPIAHATRH